MYKLCAAAVSEACEMKDLDRNQERWWYAGLLQKRGANDMPARKSKWDLRQCCALTASLLGTGEGN